MTREMGTRTETHDKRDAGTEAGELTVVVMINFEHIHWRQNVTLAMQLP